MTVEDVTQLLKDWNDGHKEALDQLLPAVYNELRRLARQYMRRERADHTLQSTDLVHEAYLRLIDQEGVSWQNRAHFYGVAAQIMRRILVDHARHHLSEKHGGAREKLSLDEAIHWSHKRNWDLVALDDALKQLTSLDERKSRIVELRFFAGLSIQETAEVLGVSPITVQRDWALAKAWLMREMSGAR